MEDVLWVNMSKPTCLCKCVGARVHGRREGHVNGAWNVQI